MFALSRVPLNITELKRQMARSDAGACVTFEGCVRNTSDGQTVNRLEYEAYESVVVEEGAKILEEARRRFDLLDVRCAHCVGTLNVGDVAVWVGATAAHRDAAYGASRYVIDAIKTRLPIWKKEHYEDGDSGWVDCGHVAENAHARVHASPPTFTEADYYARQTRLPEVGETGQAKLRAARVLVIGAGGLGSPALSYLAAAGVGTIGICEGDRLEASNLHRQTLYDHATVGEGKAGLAAKRLREQNPFVSVKVYDTKLTPGNVLDMFGPYDLILDCTDNFAAKFLINDAGVLTGKPVLFASIYQYEGQIVFVRPESGGPCLRCLWPEIPEPDCVGSCAEVGVLGAVPGIFGAMQAMEATKYILGLPDPLGHDIVLFDCLTYSAQRVRVPRQPGCPVCGVTPRIRTIVHGEYFPPANLSMDVTELDPDRLKQYRIIDIRELGEAEAHPLEGVAHEHIAMSEWNMDRLPIAADELCLLCCSAGVRSMWMAKRLRDLGCARVYSVKNGWKAFHMKEVR